MKPRNRVDHASVTGFCSSILACTLGPIGSPMRAAVEGAAGVGGVEVAGAVDELDGGGAGVGAGHLVLAAPVDRSMTATL